MIETIVLDRNSLTFQRTHAVGDATRMREVASNILWVDVKDPTSQDFEDLAREFCLHPLAIEDCQHRHQRPKVDEYLGYYFIVLYEAELSADNRLELRELEIFLGKNYLITVHTEPIRSIAVADRLWREWTDLADRGAGLLAYLLIDAVVDDYLPLLDTFSDRLDDLEDQIFEDLKPEALQEIFVIKKQLLFLRRAVTPLRDVFNTLLRREQQVFSRETSIYFQDVFDHLIRVADTIDVLRDLLGSTMDAYLSISGNRMNMVMKRLTAISTLLMSVTLVAGIYGMNFTYMPELSARSGYIWALTAMLVIALVLYFYFKRIKWL
jgi:magnesium transporter